MALKWYLEKTVILMLIVVCDSCWEEERNALLDIKASYNNYSSNSGLNLTSWGAGKADCCQWERVICNATTGHVEGIDLSYHDYNGNKRMGDRYFNASLFLPFKRLIHLKNLESLSLRGAPLDKSFLQSIGVMTSLKILDLTGCGLGGTLPSSQGICDLKHLEILFSNDNDLHGPLPWCFSNLTSLRILWINNNQFSGNISPLGSLISLEDVDLWNNNFRIPTSLKPLFNLSKLSTFVADGNEIYDDDEMDYADNSTPQFQLRSLSLSSIREFGGTFPKFLYYQHNLWEVALSNNKLRGVFPNWLLENNTELRSLSLDNNSLTGNLRLPVRSSLNLQGLDISNNLLNDRIPQDFGAYFPSMGFLSMSRNRFRGNIPSSFGNMTSLISLDISNNELSGAPNDYRSLSFKYLLELDISYNQFSGKIPQWISNSSSMTWLILRHNNFGGHVPIQLCNLQSISLLDLSNNNLSGHFPPCLSAKAATLKGGSSISGPVVFTTKGASYAFQRSILRYMSGIDLSNNKFTGPIPTEIGNLRELKVLNLSHNHLEGTIPQELSKLEQIESLDISFNKLQGPIPPQLTQLHFLAVFNVSFNNLSGEIPYGTQLSGFPNSSYMANPFLCGLPLTKRCNAIPTSPTTVVVSPSVDGGFMETEVLYVSFAIGYGVVVLTMIAVLCINPYWRRIWFGFIEWCINGSYYFFIDNLPCLYKFRYSQPCV